MPLHESTLDCSTALDRIPQNFLDLISFILIEKKKATTSSNAKNELRECADEETIEAHRV